MKKVTKISISGVSFMLDTDAERLLANYLDALTRKFGNSSENELVADIENRVAEILTEKRTSDRGVVSEDMMKSVIAQIGSVSSIERETLDAESGIRFKFNRWTGSNHIDDKVEYSESPLSKLLKIIAWIFIVLASLEGLAILTALISVAIFSDLITTYMTEAVGAAAIILGTALCFNLFFISLVGRIINKGRVLFGKWYFILSLLLISIIGTITSVFAGINFAANYGSGGRSIENVNIDLKGDTLYVVEGDECFDNENIFWWYHSCDSAKKLYVPVDIDYYDGRTDSLTYLKIRKTSRGVNRLDAEKKAAGLEFNYRVSGDTLYINRFASVLQGEVYRLGDIDVDVVSSKISKIITLPYK